MESNTKVDARVILDFCAENNDKQTQEKKNKK